jgi:ketosteroid isomerase-like protein
VTPLDEMRALLQRYARAVDQRDLPALAALFHPDAELTGARGTQSLDAWLETMRAPRTFPSSMHVLAEPLLSHQEGSETATADTYAVVYQLGDAGAGQADLTLGMRYLDQLVVHRGRWVIRNRSSTMVWMR